MKGTPNPKKKTPVGDFAMPGVDVEQLEKLLDFMAAHGLEEFEYEHAGLHIRLRKASAAAPSQPHSAVPAAPAAPPSTGASTPAVAPGIQPASSVPAPPHAEDLHIVKSPIVGTFYGSPSPDAPPFVKPGDSVRAGQVVCIVEAMKLMNEIESDVSGEVVRVLIENGQPVEYGQGLFAIRAAKKK